MVSLWAPGLPEVHTKHHHKANSCTATQCHIHTAIGFRCQKHLNMIASTAQGDANASPSPITKEASGKRRG